MPKERFFACARPDRECNYPDCLGTYCGDVAILFRHAPAKLRDEIRAAQADGKTVMVRGTGKIKPRR